jgi:hypothetical protein
VIAHPFAAGGPLRTIAEGSVRVSPITRAPGVKGESHEERQDPNHSDHASPRARCGIHSLAAATGLRRRHRAAPRTPQPAGAGGE